MSRLRAAFCITCIIIRVKSAAVAAATAAAVAMGPAKVVHRDLQQHRDLRLHTKGTIIHIQCV